MRRMHRSPALASSACAMLLALSACAAPPSGPSVNRAGEFTGTIVGPMEFGQPGEGAGLRAYGLQLAQPLKLDDKAECGEQTATVMAVESESVAPLVGKAVVLRATPYCRVSRSGKYHLKDVTVR